MEEAVKKNGNVSSEGRRALLSGLLNSSGIERIKNLFHSSGSINPVSANPNIADINASGLIRANEAKKNPSQAKPTKPQTGTGLSGHPISRRTAVLGIVAAAATTVLVVEEAIHPSIATGVNKDSTSSSTSSIVSSLLTSLFSSNSTASANTTPPVVPPPVLPPAVTTSSTLEMSTDPSSGQLYLNYLSQNSNPVESLIQDKSVGQLVFNQNANTIYIAYPANNSPNQFGAQKTQNMIVGPGIKSLSQGDAQIVIQLAGGYMAGFYSGLKTTGSSSNQTTTVTNSDISSGDVKWQLVDTLLKMGSYYDVLINVAQNGQASVGISNNLLANIVSLWIEGINFLNSYAGTPAETSLISFDMQFLKNVSITQSGYNYKISAAGTSLSVPAAQQILNIL